MARMLSDRESSASHRSTARRHQRLARRARRGALADALEPHLKTLAARDQEFEDAVFETRVALDIVLAADGEMDDAVRNLHNDGEKFDRSNPATATLPILFPEGGFSPIIDEAVADEPRSVEGLARRIDSLGAGHALAPHAATLRSAAKGVTEALAAHAEALRLEKSAEAGKELAQLALRRQYEANYLDARKLWGRVAAERLFPQTTGGKSGADDASTPSPGAAATV